MSEQQRAVGEGLTGDDLLEGEGLGDVVVAPDGQALDLVVERVAGGEEEDRLVPLGGPQARGDLEAVDIAGHRLERDRREREDIGAAKRT